MDRKSKSVVFAWNRMPLYGAKVISKIREHHSFDFPVIRTVPKVPVAGIEEILDTNLFTIRDEREISWRDLGIEIPDVFIQSGWRYKHFARLAEEVRKSGGSVIGMFDNNWRGTARQVLGVIYFRFFLRNKFRAAFVPGLKGFEFSKKLGFDDADIYQGLYCGDRNIFKNTSPVMGREKCFLFVGQFIHRKGVIELLEAFKKFRHNGNTEWSIKFVGQGSLKERLENNDGVIVEPFKQSNDIANIMNECRALVLPSRVEHWGVVVHEAALCGCGLILTSEVGAAADLASKGNAILVKKPTIGLLVNALERFSSLSDKELRDIEINSMKSSSKFSIEVWLESFDRIVNKY